MKIVFVQTHFVYIYRTAKFNRSLLNRRYGHPWNPPNPDSLIVPGGPGAASCVNGHTWQSPIITTLLSTADTRRCVCVYVCSEKQRVMLRWTLRHCAPYPPLPSPNPSGDLGERSRGREVERLAIWNFGHVGMSWAIKPERYSRDGGIRYSIVVDRDLRAGCAMRPKLRIQCQKWFWFAAVACLRCSKSGAISIFPRKFNFL